MLNRKTRTTPKPAQSLAPTPPPPPCQKKRHQGTGAQKKQKEEKQKEEKQKEEKTKRRKTKRRKTKRRKTKRRKNKKKKKQKKKNKKKKNKRRKQKEEKQKEEKQKEEKQKKKNEKKEEKKRGKKSSTNICAKINLFTGGGVGSDVSLKNHLPNMRLVWCGQRSDPTFSKTRGKVAIMCEQSSSGNVFRYVAWLLYNATRTPKRSGGRGQTEFFPKHSVFRRHPVQMGSHKFLVPQRCSQNFDFLFVAIGNPVTCFFPHHLKPISKILDPKPQTLNPDPKP